MKNNMKNILAHPVEVYRSTTWYFKKEWRWRITANNGKIIAASSEGYRNKEDLIRNMASIVGSLSEFLNNEIGEITYRNAKVEIKKENE